MSKHTFTSIINSGIDFGNTIFGTIVALLFVFVLWTAAKFLLVGETKDIGKTKNQLVVGTIALTVAVSVWALVAYVQNTIFPS